MKVNVNRLVSLSEKNLEKYENSACYEDDTTPPDIPEWDPGLRPMGKNGTHQPKLPRFPKNDNIPSNKEQHCTMVR